MLAYFITHQSHNNNFNNTLGLDTCKSNKRRGNARRVIVPAHQPRAQYTTLQTLGTRVVVVAEVVALGRRYTSVAR